MQPEAPTEQGPSTEDSENLPPAAKRRRQSPLDVPESSNAPSVAKGLVDVVTHSPQSREESAREAEMQRSASPQDSSIRYTRTGRVSRASKGQRVHDCKACGKIYTRAEHLRRHEQNHKPGAFLCDVPRCGRSFYREDLLTRHKERHNDPLNPPTRRASITSHISPTDGGPPTIVTAGQATPSLPAPIRGDLNGDTLPDVLRANGPATAPQAAPSVRYDTPRLFREPQSLSSFFDFLALWRYREPRAKAPWELPVGPPVIISVETSGVPYAEYPYGVLFDPSPPYSPSGYTSPTNEYSYSWGGPYYNQPSSGRTRHGSSADVYGQALATSSRSPLSAGSSSAHMHHWGACSQSPAGLQHLPSTSSSEGVFAADPLERILSAHMVPVFSNGVLRMITAEERDLIETDELLIPTGSPPVSMEDFTLDTNPLSNESRYAEAYWEQIHPLFPVVHKPTFDLRSASPLLRAAMFALGAHTQRNHVDMNNARVIHEQCTRTLKKRSASTWHTYRPCDMQAIFLCEVFAVFKCRRPPLHLSKNFEDVYRLLVADYDAMTPETATPLNDSPLQSRTYSSNLADSMQSDIDAQCKRRLLHACYILDQQHVMLFGRQPTDCLSSSVGGLIGLNLPMLMEQSFFDALPEDQLAKRLQDGRPDLAQQQQVYHVLAAVPTMLNTLAQPHDTLQSMLMLACLTDTKHDLITLGFDDDADLSAVLNAIEQTPRMRLAYHTLMLARNTPIRDLLAVAGESWVVGEKLSSADQYIAAQLAARDWAATTVLTGLPGHGGADQARSPAQRAVFHALQILGIHSSHPETGLLFQEWSVYLAAVVIWARSYFSTSEARRKPRLSVPSPTEPKLPILELDACVAALITAGPSAVISWISARHALMWAKSQIEKVDILHNCGLTNGALDILGKLITRGNEDGWFA
ncbi:hypothetical protein BAUCODRAFT_27452 [Baudoinia panamericana UAMH 10762]|uniref:C2H2-type domain-containing protein n=1 Tax=Baudoinia panamericana (strain UAMH 10762) TaxID=717646 RepID=M2MZK7_BAUPA|nr:uncharacterized protein BAUCODRAFT_27452 [Baudoinia panamericana UAMH 10762]EMC92099.1 hypothetical protein BAUCODRAFT_27452 [Baudoinia panamericana UAMH 10762]